MILDIIILVIALLLSAFFSGTETAFTASGRLSLEVYKRHDRRGASLAGKLLSRPKKLFSTTLVGNNLVGVLYSSLAALFLLKIGLPLEWIFVISPIFILIFGEILPKSVAREVPERWALVTSIPLEMCYWLLYPFIKIAGGTSDLLLRAFGHRDSDVTGKTISLSDLKVIWNDLGSTGRIDSSEIELLDQVVSLRDVKMRDVMTPRTEIVAIKESDNIQSLEQLVTSRGFTRMPVYSNSLDEIIGIVNAMDLLVDPESLDEIIRPVSYVPEQASVSKYLDHFRHKDIGMLVVVDEYGGTAGIITLEDLIEVLVGDIQDEHDRQFVSVKKVSKDVRVYPGKIQIDYLRNHWKIDLPDGNYDTLSGFILSRLGKIPDVGEVIIHENWRLRIVATDNNKIKKVLIRKMQRKAD